MVKRNVAITLEKAIEWYNSDDESLKDLALQAFTKEELIYNFRDITTFKKACDKLSYNYDDIISKVNSIAEISKASAAMFKLNIVRKALNAGHDMHISRNVDGQKYSHYPFFALVIKGSTCYRGSEDIDKHEKLGEFTSERTVYEVFNLGVYSNIDYNKGTVTAIHGQIKWAETTDPVLWLKQKHLMIGKPAKVVVYKGY